MIADKHSLRSSTREEYVEYVFLAKLCSHGWSKNRFVEVARTQTDASGYDLVLSEGLVTRHVQLKASKRGAKAKKQKINIELSNKPSGCVVWIVIDAETLEPQNYLWFGDKPGEPLPDLGERIAKHTKGNSEGVKAERFSMREVGTSSFISISGIEGIFEVLFGPTEK